ncbi:MAG: hydroxymethylbilane synthase [Candidatus Wallbacteria bacterium]|nr:hydroxymethylbilane synthase [Candidatus Wallbacteria bacterium]
MSPRVLRLGTRGSKLALWQANHVRDLLSRSHPGLEIEISVVKTSADVDQKRPLDRFATQGVFVKELETALLQKTVDFAVHSLKDVPTQIAGGLTLGAILEREDPRDTLVTPDGVALDDLEEGATVGTSSPRRVAQLMNVRPDLKTKDIRGNLDTRLRKMQEGDYGCLVLARAGLVRLAPPGVRHVPLSLEQMLPAPGQGAIAVELRADDVVTTEFIRSLHHDHTAKCVEAERAMLGALGGGCQLPVGCLASVSPRGKLVLRGIVADRQGRKLLRADGMGTNPTDVGNRVAEKLRYLGADYLLG